MPVAWFCNLHYVAGLLYAVGGYDGASRQCLSSVESYNPLCDTWLTVSEMSCRRSGAGMTCCQFSFIFYPRCLSDPRCLYYIKDGKQFSQNNRKKHSLIVSAEHLLVCTCNVSRLELDFCLFYFL